MKVTTESSHFHTTHSPIKKEYTQGTGNAPDDMFRIRHHVVINGKLLTALIDETETGDFEKQYDEFLGKHIVNSESFNEQQKTKIINYLRHELHQGGWLQPLRHSIAHILSKEGMNTPNPNIQVVNIIPTEEGLKIQHRVVYNSIQDTTTMVEGVDGRDKLYEYEPEPPEPFVISAQATFELNFRDCFTNKSPSEPLQPTFNISNSTISYGNKAVQSKMDKRSFLDKLVDYFKQLLGYNKEQITAIKASDEHSEQSAEEEDTSRPQSRM